MSVMWSACHDVIVSVLVAPVVNKFGNDQYFELLAVWTILIVAIVELNQLIVTGSQQRTIQWTNSDKYTILVNCPSKISSIWHHDYCVFTLMIWHDCIHNLASIRNMVLINHAYKCNHDYLSNGIVQFTNKISLSLNQALVDFFYLYCTCITTYPRAFIWVN